MDIENLPPSLQFVFIAMMESAIIFKENEKNKEYFLSFSEEIWESMELSDIEYLKEVLEEKMKKDIEPYVKSYINNLRK